MDLGLICGSCFDHLACFCTQVLGLVFVPFVQLLKKEVSYEKNSNRRPLKLPVRNCVDEREAFGSLLLEIVIMLTL